MSAPANTQIRMDLQAALKAAVPRCDWQLGFLAGDENVTGNRPLGRIGMVAEDPHGVRRIDRTIVISMQVPVPDNNASNRGNAPDGKAIELLVSDVIDQLAVMRAGNGTFSGMSVTRVRYPVDGRGRNTRALLEIITYGQYHWQ
jgi:hypothetical protein